MRLLRLRRTPTPPDAELCESCDEVCDDPCRRRAREARTRVEAARAPAVGVVR